jgi:hypothetical protein
VATASSGASRASASGSVEASRTATVSRPASAGGTWGSGGSRRSATDVVAVSGRAGAHVRHRRSTRAASSPSKCSAPPWTCVSGSRSNSTAVTTPVTPLPPRSAQNRSAEASAVARTRRPPPVTTSKARTRSLAAPNVRASGPRPPPVV